MPGDPDPSAVNRAAGKPREPGPDRRTVVGGLLSTVLLAVTGACSGSSAGSSTAHHDSAPQAAEDPDAGLLVGLRAAELDLIGQYDAVIAQFPAIAARLTPMRADHAAHLAALGGALPEPSATPTGAPQADAGQAAAGLAGAERSAASARISECRSAHDARLAALVAAIGGSEAAHATLLAELATQHTPAPTKKPTPQKHSAATE